MGPLKPQGVERHAQGLAFDLRRVARLARLARRAQLVVDRLHADGAVVIGQAFLGWNPRTASRSGRRAQGRSARPRPCCHSEAPSVPCTSPSSPGACRQGGRIDTLALPSAWLEALLLPEVSFAGMAQSGRSETCRRRGSASPSRNPTVKDTPGGQRLRVCGEVQVSREAGHKLRRLCSGLWDAPVQGGCPQQVARRTQLL